MHPVRTIREDIQVVKDRDPAARNSLEILLCYPGLHAVWMHRLAHRFWRWDLKTVARWISHVSRLFTGIEIHPGAHIGRRFFVDHGMGVVIGETTEVGHDVLLYQGVTLGGTSLEHGKRHPTLGSNVVVGAGAKVLGPVHIGDGVRIGASSVVVTDVSPGTTVVGIPAKPVGRRPPSEAQRIDLHHEEISDPIARSVDLLERRIRSLEHELYRRSAREQEEEKALERTTEVLDYQI
jgi:serine O-acetyltransferase